MQTFQPDVVVLNAGFAHVIGFGPIIMGAEDVLKPTLCCLKRRLWRPIWKPLTTAC